MHRRSGSGGSVTTRPPNGLIEVLDLREVNQLYALDDELSDAHAAGDFDRLAEIVVDEAYLNLPAVVGIDGARGIDYRKTVFGGQSRAWMDKPHRT